MRIAYVYDALYPYVTGGAERRYFELGRRLARRGHDVEFVSWRYAPGPQAESGEGVTLHGVGRPPALHDRSGKRTFREAIAFAARCAPVLARLDADVVDCSSIPYVPTFIAAALQRRRSRLIVTWHEYMGARWREYRRHGASVAALVERATASLGSERVAVSEFTARRLPRGPKVTVVENGIDVAAIHATTPVAEATDIVVAGRLVPHKRVDLLLDVLARVPDATAIVIGDGPERPAIEQHACDLGVADRVRFAGWLPRAEDVYAHLRGARALLVLSEQEGFGMTVLEAQAAGAVPVVVRSPLSAATDLVADHITGLAVERDADDIATAVRRVLHDGSLRETMRAGAAAAATRYDWDAIAARMEAVYAGEVAPAHAEQRWEQAA